MKTDKRELTLTAYDNNGNPDFTIPWDTHHYKLEFLSREIRTAHPEHIITVQGMVYDSMKEEYIPVHFLVFPEYIKMSIEMYKELA